LRPWVSNRDITLDGVDAPPWVEQDRAGDGTLGLCNDLLRGSDVRERGQDVLPVALPVSRHLGSVLLVGGQGDVADGVPIARPRVADVCRAHFPPSRDSQRIRTRWSPSSTKAAPPATLRTAWRLL